MCRVPWWFSQVWRSRQIFGFAVATIFAIALATTVVTLQASASEPSVRHLAIILNKSKTVSFAMPFKTASIASTDIADVTPLTDRSLYIQGKKIGTTSISVFDQNMQLIELLDLEVTLDTKDMQDKIRAGTGSSIRVSSSNSQVFLSGMAPNAVAADRAVSIAKSMVKTGDIVNAMTVAASQQVMLQVRFLEATRTAERDLGVNWFGTKSNGSVVSTGLGTANNGVSVAQTGTAILSATGTAPFGVVLANLVNGGTNIDVMVSALESKGLVRRLAEPNLVALSGDTAKFLAGGSFPVPTISSTTTGTTTPTFQMVQFGVSLSFVPTVLGQGLINLRIAPEVSELDFANAVTISGTTIPSLVIRNAQTTVELRDGQSFAIAGLLQTRGARNVQQLPWIGSVPVLGTLFRSAAFQNSETDLVIIVTPHLVQPGTPMDRLATPLDQRLPSNDADLFINGQMEVPKRYSDFVTSGGDVKGPYGFIIPVEQGSNQPVYKGGAAK